MTPARGWPGCTTSPAGRQTRRAVQLQASSPMRWRWCTSGAAHLVEGSTSAGLQHPRAAASPRKHRGAQAPVREPLLNARDAMPLGGNRLDRGAARGRLRRGDRGREGTGIAAENLERVFDAFLSTKRNGTGLGPLDGGRRHLPARRIDLARNRARVGASSCSDPLAVHDEAARSSSRAGPRPPFGIAARPARDDDRDCLEVTQRLRSRGTHRRDGPGGADALRRLGRAALRPAPLRRRHARDERVAGRPGSALHWPAMPIFMVTGWGHRARVGELRARPASTASWESPSTSMSFARRSEALRSGFAERETR